MCNYGDRVRIRQDALPNPKTSGDIAARGKIGTVVEVVYQDGDLSMWLIKVDGVGCVTLYADEFEPI
jgi:hypothetical protein